MKLNQTSFRTRINIVYAFLHLLAVAGIALGIGAVSNDLLKKETEKNLNQNIALACERLDALLDKIENASLHFTVTEAYKETYETSEDWSSYENFLFTSSITSHLLEFLSVQKDIYSMAFFSYDGKSFYRSFDEASAFNSSQNQEELLEKFLSEDCSSQWYVSPTQEDPAKPEFVFFRKMYNLNGRLRGILSLTLANNSLHQLISQDLAQDAAFALVFSESNFSPLVLSSSEYDTQDRNTSLITVKEDYPRLSCSVATQVPRKSVYKNSYILVCSIIIIGISTLLLCLFLLFMTTKHLLSPLEKIISTVKVLSRGDYSARISSPLTDEIGILANQIDKMAESTQNLMKKIEDTSERKKEYEVAYLQMQMRPHFLYNTLETLCGMITIHEYQNSIALINDMSRFYRDVLSGGNSIVTLKKELDISKNYLEIMSTRYPDQFEYRIYIEEDILDCSIPKLTLQPLLENAVIHGFVPAAVYGTITITGYRKKETVFLSVMDDGGGMSKEKRLSLCDRTSSNHKISFWVPSAEERLRLYLGDSCELTIDSAPDRGTKIQLSFPYIPLKSQEDTL